MQESEPSRLKFVLNTWTICNLPETSKFPRGMSARQKVNFILEAGYVGLQMEPEDPLLEAGLAAGMHMSATGRVLSAKHANYLCQVHRDKGFALTTLHVGTGFETHDEGMRLMSGVLDASARHGYPLYVETHRATLTQDPRRTLDFVRAFPDLLLNIDLSHWYAGCEMPYGNFRAKLEALRPVFERTRYLHGRVSDSSCIQVPVGRVDDTNSRHFHQMWSRCFLGFLERTASTEPIYFAPELLPNSMMRNACPIEINYARMKQTPDGPVEETDRWRQGQLLCVMARKAFKRAEAWYQVKRGPIKGETATIRPEISARVHKRVSRTSA